VLEKEGNLALRAGQAGKFVGIHTAHRTQANTAGCAARRSVRFVAAHTAPGLSIDVAAGRVEVSEY